LAEQNQRQLITGQIVAAREALVTTPSDKKSSIVPKIIVALGVIILISAIIAYRH
jgi:hypothetical protein